MIISDPAGSEAGVGVTFVAYRLQELTLLGGTETMRVWLIVDGWVFLSEPRRLADLSLKTCVGGVEPVPKFMQGCSLLSLSHSEGAIHGVEGS